VKDGLVAAARVLVVKEDGKSSNVLPDFNPLKESQQFFLRRRKLVGKVRGAEHAQRKAAKSEREESNNNKTKKQLRSQRESEVNAAARFRRSRKLTALTTTETPGTTIPW